jgi:membrane-bound metal-dependent hydrolase YbcI (DUF457 family)
MANFRTHISFGIAFGVLGAMLMSGLAALYAPSFLITVFVVATLGSVLPDIDSDSSLPFHVAFGSLTIVICALVFARLRLVYSGDYKLILGYTALTGVFVWGVLGYLFRKFTVHRGIVHSLPAALLVGLGTFFLASRFYFSDADAFVLAVAMAGGFLTHLVLDEIWALVNFQGKILVPNKAFGTALKLFSESRTINFLIYGAILFLLYGNYDRLLNLAKGFLENIK